MDNAERTQVAEALRQTNETLQALIRAAPLAIVVLDRSANVVQWSPAAERLFGWRAEEVLGRPMPGIPDDQREAFQALIEGELRGETRVALELRRQRKDGSLVDVNLWTAPLHDAQGQVMGAIGFLADISERKQVEAAEREQRAFAEALRDTAAVLNITVNSDAVLDSILANVSRVVAHDTADIILIESGVGHIVRARGYAELGLNEDAVSPLAFPVNDFASLSQMLKTGQPMAIPDTQDYPGWVDVPEYRLLRSYAGAPIRIEGQVIGCLAVGSTTPGSYTAIHSERLQAFADQAALVLFNARLYEQVHTGHNRLEALSRRLLDVQEAERRHIARELHDEIGQALTGLTLLLEMIKRLPPEAIRSQLDEAQSLAAALMDRVHNLSLDLRPTMLDDLGLLPALLSHVARYTEQTGVQVIFEHEGVDRRFGADIETAAYRIVQEALTNVARHAGVAEAAVRLWADQHNLRVQVEDRGAGFDPEAAAAARTTLGLDGMRERATLVGGQFTVEAAPGSGALLTAELPVRSRA
jgi:PAS domain S-box-containing protein